MRVKVYSLLCFGVNTKAKLGGSQTYMKSKVIKDEIVRVLKTDSELEFNALKSSDRITQLKARAKAIAVLATPEAISVAVEIMRSSESEKIRLEAVKVILDRGLGTVAEEDTTPYTKTHAAMSNEEIDGVLGEGGLDDVSN